MGWHFVALHQSAGFSYCWFSIFMGHGILLKVGIKLRAGFSYVHFTDSINTLDHATWVVVPLFQPVWSVQILCELDHRSR
jgi:hypothetical protein